MIEIYKMEQERKWRERSQMVPGLSFDPSWSVRIIPPFAGADARFVVKSGKAEVSIYLDFDDRLGCVGQPYWEIYPMDGDCARYMIGETTELLDGIAESIRQQNAL